MQTRVAKRLRRVITVSQNSFDDICRDHKVSPEQLHIVPVGVDPDLFLPLAGVERVPGQLITTRRADVTMKGLRYLLEALAKLRTDRPELRLVIIGRLKEGSAAQRTIDELGLERRRRSSSPASPTSASSSSTPRPSCAVVPSLYEGFSLPAIEAMSCGCPWSPPPAAPSPRSRAPTARPASWPSPATARRSPPGSAAPSTTPTCARRIGAAGRERVIDRWSWRHTAVRTVEQYRALLAESAGSPRS